LKGLAGADRQTINNRAAGIKRDRVRPGAIDYGIVKSPASVVGDGVRAPICGTAPIAAAIGPSGNDLAISFDGLKSTEKEKNC
jgi:LDH2 family malate/lactate/ureidoglycolate dehydrogenase